MEIEDKVLSEAVIGAAIEVHRALGPGLLESMYCRCLERELKSRCIQFERELSVPVFYKGERLDFAYRVDLVVERKLVIETKAVDCILPVHMAQVMTYMKLLEIHRGLLFNFKVSLLRDGIRSIVL